MPREVEIFCGKGSISGGLGEMKSGAYACAGQDYNVVASLEEFDYVVNGIVLRELDPL